MKDEIYMYTPIKLAPSLTSNKLQPRLKLGAN